MKRLRHLAQVQHEARTLGLGPYRRSAISPLLVPQAYEDPNFPRCALCNHALLDSIEMVDGNRTSVVILGKHHGAEDYFRIDFEKPYTQDDLSRALRSTILFRPEHFENDAAK